MIPKQKEPLFTWWVDFEETNSHLIWANRLTLFDETHHRTIYPSRAWVISSFGRFSFVFTNQLQQILSISVLILFPRSQQQHSPTPNKLSCKRKISFKSFSVSLEFSPTFINNSLIFQWSFISCSSWANLNSCFLSNWRAYSKKIFKETTEFK